MGHRQDFPRPAHADRPDGAPPTAGRDDAAVTITRPPRRPRRTAAPGHDGPLLFSAADIRMNGSSAAVRAPSAALSE
jgi:hypothetical protein